MTITDIKQVKINVHNALPRFMTFLLANGPTASENILTRTLGFEKNEIFYNAPRHCCRKSLTRIAMQRCGFVVT